MNPLQRALIEKVGHDNGFEYAPIPVTSEVVKLASARHQACIAVALNTPGWTVTVESGPTHLLLELGRSFEHWLGDDADFIIVHEADLGLWMRRAAALARALPNQVVTDYEAQVGQAVATLPADQVHNTEVLRMVRQRVGQQTYRQALLNYWGGACSVTGLTSTSALRASHAKPWAECASDAERLDVFNGFLLSANLDALFDQYLISFGEDGKLLVSEVISVADRLRLGLVENVRLRWIAVDHLSYLAFHRAKFLG
jgi:putative restriction endonuclease